MALYRDLTTGNRYVTLGTRTGAEIPQGSRLIAHTQPGAGPAAVRASVADEAALSRLGQRSSVIIDEQGTAATRFRATEAGAEAARTETGGVRVSAPEVGSTGARTSAQPVVHPAHIQELTASGVNFTAEAVVATGRTSAGQVVFLETGNAAAGLQHIVRRHGAEFAAIGVPESEIPNVVMRAVTDGKVVGSQGAGAGRPIYETTINGQGQKNAVTVGKNGFIVGTNPAGRVK